MGTKYNVVWYWIGGSERGHWGSTDYTPNVRAELRRMGYVAHDGLRVIGAPESAPSASELHDVLSASNPVEAHDDRDQT